MTDDSGDFADGVDFAIGEGMTEPRCQSDDRLREAAQGLADWLETHQDAHPLPWVKASRLRAALASHPEEKA